MSNLVEYGLKNVHYATLGMSGSEVTYGTPIPMPGAVTLTMSPEGDKTTFRADNRVYFEKSANNGYAGTLELARIPESFRVNVLKNKLDSAKGIYYEDASALPEAFALLFEVDGDESATKFVYYNVTAERPEQGGETTGDTLEPKTESMGISARPSVDKNIVKAWHSSTSATNTVSSGWYSAVQLPSNV